MSIEEELTESDDNVYSLESLLHFMLGGPDNPPSLLDGVELRRWLPRLAWAQRPVVAVQYAAEDDELIVDLLSVPSVAIREIDGRLALGFDGDDDQALPTTMCLLGLRRDATGKAVELAERMLGDRLWEVVLELLSKAGGGHSDVLLSPEEKESRLAAWDGIAEQAEGLAGAAAASAASTPRPAVRTAAAGFELLPYQLRAVLVDEGGNVLEARSAALADMEVQDVVDAARSLTSQLTQDMRADHLPAGFQIGAPVDSSTGTVIYYRKEPALSEDHSPYTWKDVPLAQLLEEATGLRTTVVNDAEAFAMYEQLFGVGKRLSDYVVLVVREGVGASAVIDGKILDIPMEAGNIVLHPDHLRCDCGNVGCMETHAGTTGMLNHAVPLLEDSSISNIEQLAWLAEFGSDKAREVAAETFRRAGCSTARIIGVLITLFRPDAVVLYCPKVLTPHSGGRAAAAFRRGVDEYPQHTFPPLLTENELAEPFRPYRPELGAQAAALVALNRILGRQPETGPQSASSGEDR